MNWKLLTTAVSTYLLQQDGFPGALDTTFHLQQGVVGLALHGVYYVSVAAMVTEVARWAAPRISKAFSREATGRQTKSGTASAAAPQQPRPTAPATTTDSEEQTSGPAPKAATNSGQSSTTFLAAVASASKKGGRD